MPCPWPRLKTRAKNCWDGQPVNAKQRQRRAPRKRATHRRPGGRKRCFLGTRSASLSCSVREAPRGGQRAMGAHCARRQAMRRQSLHLRRAGLLFRGAERNSHARSALLYKLCFATRAGDIFVALSALAHNLASNLRWALKISNSSRAVDPAATTGADRPSLCPPQSWATQSTKASKGCAAALLGARKNEPCNGETGKMGLVFICLRD